jgi:C4-dicarboxylate-specific signal transduction histidine kinase
MNSVDLTAVGHGLAGLTHDMKNVLAIIGESIGLVNDLVPAGPDERIASAFERISRQLDRADGMVTRWNRFAHTFDDPEVPQPLSHLVDQALLLVDRRARSRAVEVDAVLENDLEVPGAVAFLLRLAVLLESAVDSLPAGSRLRVTSDGTRVIVTGDPGGMTATARSAELLTDTEGPGRQVDFSRGGIAAIRLPRP